MFSSFKILYASASPSSDMYRQPESEEIFQFLYFMLSCPIIPPCSSTFRSIGYLTNSSEDLTKRLYAAFLIFSFISSEPVISYFKQRARKNQPFPAYCCSFTDFLSIGGPKYPSLFKCLSRADQSSSRRSDISSKYFPSEVTASKALPSQSPYHS